jgi:hypothetical protein
MISVQYNDVMKAVEILMDEVGADLLIARLVALKAGSHCDHLHIRVTDDDRGLAGYSPYGGEIFSEVILGILPSDAWRDSNPASR